MTEVLIAVNGSFGDLYPMLAVAARLQALAAKVTLVAPSFYRQMCERHGFEFTELGRARDYVESIQYDRTMLTDTGTGELMDRSNFQPLEQRYAETLAAADSADAVVAPLHVVPAHLVAEKKRIPFIACALGMAHLTSPTAGGRADKAYAARTARWHKALSDLRRKHGLARQALPCTSMLRSASCTLGLLPAFLAQESSYITNLEIVGYPQYQQSGLLNPFRDEELRTFCDSRTVVFSFGSFADACDPSSLFEESVAACRMLGLKCLYLSRYVDTEIAARVAGDDVILRDYVPHREVFPLVGAIVHHGGTGTLMHACEYAKPMVIVPFFLDQPLHAARMQSLIGAQYIPWQQYQRSNVAGALAHTLQNAASLRTKLAALKPDCGDGAERAALRILSVVGADGAKHGRGAA
jgi:rhamnosyltransferase subunit B